VIPPLRRNFNDRFTAKDYSALLCFLEERCHTKVEFRVAETPVFVPSSLLETLADGGANLAARLIEDSTYLNAARQAIPKGYCVPDETAHPNFLTADFALIRKESGELVPKLVEIQAFPSVFGYQAALCSGYRHAFGLPETLDVYLGGLRESTYWDLLRRTVLGDHAPENVVLTEVDPQHQKTLPDFLVTADRLGIQVVDISTLQPVGNKLFYRNAAGKLVRIERIYNRAIADELIARNVSLPFGLTRSWEVEWAGHPNWYFLISKYSIPLLSQLEATRDLVPPAVFLGDFLEGTGAQSLAAAGVPLPRDRGSDTRYGDLLLKPLFSFAGKGIQFEPSRAQLEAIPRESRRNYLLQQRMRFEPTIDTPFGMTQAEIRILYLWPDEGRLTPVIPLVRLGRGKMMGVDHNKNQEWVGGSAAFYPAPDSVVADLGASPCARVT
jgi:hypothetical protein